MFECLELGRNDEAVSAAEHAVSVSNNDAGLHANLALAYTMAARIPDARTSIRTALEKDPTDSISKSLSRVIEEIATGKRRQPRTLAEVEGRSH